MDLNLALKFSRDNFLKAVFPSSVGNLTLWELKANTRTSSRSVQFNFASLLPILLVDNLRDRLQQFLLGIVRLQIVRETVGYKVERSYLVHDLRV